MNAAQLLDRQKGAGFPPRLIEHHRIVSQVACELAKSLSEIGLDIDVDRAEVMACIHDAGKSIAKDELSDSGSAHEELGVAVAENLGCSSSISKICKSHSSITTEGLDIEEIVVRLADKLWKGKRDSDFEKQAVSRFAKLLDRDDWEVFIEADKMFELIAEAGHQRVESTRD